MIALVLVAALAASAPAQELDQVVAGVEATYGKVTDLRADFAQIATNKSLGQDIKAEGTVYLKKGGKMRWDYKSPSPQQIVSDGTSLWVYTPELNQVNKGNAPKALAGPAGSFLAGLGKVRDEFTVRFLNPANKVDSAGRFVLDLTPKAPTPLLTRLVLAVDPKDYIVRQAVLYDQLQNTVTMNFTKVTANAALSDSIFTFTPPAGAAVVPLEMR
jgi:outer membrane lipoprotein carrier protein